MLAEAPAYVSTSEALMGLARLMAMAYAGVDLVPVGMKLIERVTANPNDADALMDLSTVMQLDFAPDVALGLQAQALAMRRIYHLPAACGRASIRLLALMAPGELMANAPLEFLVENSDISLDMLYISPDLPLPESLPAHDLVFVAVNQSEANRPILERIESLIKAWPRPVLNAPDQIASLARDRACALLVSAPGMVMVNSAWIDKRRLQQIAREEASIAAVLDGYDFPVIVRPVDSHAGRGLSKLDDRSAIADYLQPMAENDFYVSRFIDYRSADGLYRKYRIVMIGGRPFACHMAVSAHWMVHYLNAGMSESAEKRAEEARFMADFDNDFALRHAEALSAISERFSLDYLVIDCAETADGKLLVFELDSGAVVHAMDPVSLFPYKQPQMRKIFGAFRELLLKTMARAQAPHGDRHDDGA
jgi:hypothetical protein